MILAIDIGNTQITIGLYDDQKLVFVSRLAADPTHTQDQYAIALKNVMELHGHSHKDIDGAVVSSVVPSVGHSVCEALQRLCGVKSVEVGPGIKTGLQIAIDNPAQLGSDLVVGAVAAAAKYPLPAIIFDFGTATKVSVLDEDGCFLGCAITAGINMSLEALSRHTALLPSIVAQKPGNIIGKNTVDAMRSGLFFGNVALIDGMSAHIEKELGREATVIVTGGLSAFLRDQPGRSAVFDESLLLDGLRLVFEMNRPV